MNLETIIVLQNEWQKLAQEYNSLLENNKQYKLRYDNFKFKHQQEDGESYWEYNKRISKFVTNATSLEYKDSTGYKAKIDRLRILITQAMLQWQRSINETNLY